MASLGGSLSGLNEIVAAFIWVGAGLSVDTMSDLMIWSSSFIGVLVSERSKKMSNFYVNFKYLIPLKKHFHPKNSFEKNGDERAINKLLISHRELN